MALPTIIINNSTGSNTAASGAGPSTAVTGSGAATTSAGNTVDVSADSPDLSGIATDGSAVLWVLSSSGRQFSKITAVNNTTKVITVEDNYANTEGSRTWAVGGKRKDFETINSHTKKLGSDNHVGWTIDIEQTGTDYVFTSTWLINSGVPGQILIKSSSETAPTMTSSTDSVDIITIQSSYQTIVHFENLKFTHTASGTRGIGIYAAYPGGSIRMYGCWFDGCYAGTYITGGVSYFAEHIGSRIENCTLSGVYVNNNYASLFLRGCLVSNNAIGMYCFAANGIDVHDSVIAGNTGKGIQTTSHYAGSNITVIGNTFHNNGSDHVAIASNVIAQFEVKNNIFWGSGGYDIYGSVNNSNFYTKRFCNNAYGGYTSGHKNSNIPQMELAGISLSADPCNADYSLNNTAGGGAACRAAGFPTTIPGVTAPNYRDVGALQHQDSGGSSGPVGRNVVIQNIGTY